MQRFTTGVASVDGIQLAPGLNLSSTVAVPALNIPPTRAVVQVATASGVVQQAVLLRVSVMPANQGHHLNMIFIMQTNANRTLRCATST
jgi:hypothetical protein